LIRELLISLAIATSPVTPNDVTDSEVDPILMEASLCLADNIYHEARGQGTAGWLAVANVTINRVKDSRYPNTVCEVVKQGPHRPSWKGTGEMIPIRHRCQFSWYCDGRSDDIGNNTLYSLIYDLSYNIVYGNIDFIDITDGATHYHADYVMPDWAKTKTKTVEIEDHIFYRWE
jgi:N-acetylmuramoyl-L-alanine amidase